MMGSARGIARSTVPARESTTHAAPPPTAIEAGKPPIAQHAADALGVRVDLEHLAAVGVEHQHAACA